MNREPERHLWCSLIEVLKHVRLLRGLELGGDECYIELEDQTGGAGCYPCRVVETDGQLAVSSPMWVG